MVKRNAFKSSKGKRTFRGRPRGRRGGLANMIKKIALKQSEPKMASQLFSSLSNPGHLTLKHNVTNYTLNLLKTNQAVTANPGTNVQSNRIGNEIVAKGLKVRMQLINAPTKANVTYKWYLFRYNSDKATMTDADFWSGTDGTGANQNRMIDFVDTREVTILKSGMIQTAGRTANMNQSTNYTNSSHPYILGTASDGSTPGMHSTYRDIWIPLKDRKILYDGNNSPVPKFTDIGLAVVCYDVNNTSQETTLGYLDFTSRLYFKDP